MTDYEFETRKLRISKEKFERELFNKKQKNKLDYVRGKAKREFWDSIKIDIPNKPSQYKSNGIWYKLNPQMDAYIGDLELYFRQLSNPDVELKPPTLKEQFDAVKEKTEKEEAYNREKFATIIQNNEKAAIDSLNSANALQDEDQVRAELEQKYMETIRKIAEDNKKHQKPIHKVQSYLKKSLRRARVFDFEFSSLVGNSPNIFDDYHYVSVKSLVKNTITKEEIEAYKRGDVDMLYDSLESLLMCNFTYYNRILNYLMLVYHHYVLIGKVRYKDIIPDIDEVVYELEMTPTQVYLATLHDDKTTEWGFKHAYTFLKNVKFLQPEEGKSFLQTNFAVLNKYANFRVFHYTNAERLGINGFRNCFKAEHVPNDRQADVLYKYIHNSSVLTRKDLQHLNQYISDLSDSHDLLYKAIDDCLFKVWGNTEKYQIYVFSNEVFIFTPRYRMKIRKEKDGRITKDYISNNIECLRGEMTLTESIPAQINWAKFRLDNDGVRDKKKTINLLFKMLEDKHTDLICRKQAYNMEGKNYTEITFKGIFNNVKMIERFYDEKNTVVFVQEKTLSKRNAAQWIADRGYFAFGREEEFHKARFGDTAPNNDKIVDLYMNYTRNITDEVIPIVRKFRQNAENILKFVTGQTKNLPVEEFSNHLIKYTDMKLKNLDGNWRELLLEEGLDDQMANDGIKRFNTYAEMMQGDWRVIEHWNVSGSLKAWRYKKVWKDKQNYEKYFKNQSMWRPLEKKPGEEKEFYKSMLEFHKKRERIIDKEVFEMIASGDDLFRLTKERI